MEKFRIHLLGLSCIIGACTMFPAFAQEKPVNHQVVYDMRTGLDPSRLTIAMWDFSWLTMHYKGGAYEDYDKVTDELLERGFNTVRIDAFPLVIGKLGALDQKVTIPGMPLENWGPSDKDRKHAIVSELLDFMTVTKRKNIKVILSSWGYGAKEFPNIKDDYMDMETFWKAWEKTLDLLKANDLIDHVAYVDFDQEFPWFSPFLKELERLGLEKTHDDTQDDPLLQAMEAAGKAEQLSWNAAQMAFVKNYMEKTLGHFQKRYPELRFTFSLTSFWKEVRALKVTGFDVLELHFWMTTSGRFHSRVPFGAITKNRDKNQDYKDYMDRLEKTMQAIRPMLLKDMHNQLAWAKEWSEEIAAPLTTTEAWGPWWHMDHKDLDWQWLYDWCEEGMGLSSEYGLWGTTPWNFSHPYWNNWDNVQWYKKVNTRFLQN